MAASTFKLLPLRFLQMAGDTFKLLLCVLQSENIGKMAQPEEVKYSHIQVSKFLGFQPLSPGLTSLGFSPIWPAPQRRSVDTSNSPLRLLFPAVACKVGKGCITTKNPTVSWGRSGGVLSVIRISRRIISAGRELLSCGAWPR